MEIVEESAAMLSNYEVYTMLQELQKGQKLSQKRHNKSKQALAAISNTTLEYLEKTPCHWQSPEVIATFVRALQPFKLTKAEKLQLLNQRPQSAVELQLMIEESEERLTEEQIDKLLELLTTHLPSPVPESAPGDAQPTEEAMVS